MPLSVGSLHGGQLFSDLLEFRPAQNNKVELFYSNRRQPMSIVKIISGGQTGVDRAALDAAAEAGLQAGGWCRKGRRADDGTIPDRYVLKEFPSHRYSHLIHKNVIESDATLILTPTNELPTGGTGKTLRIAINAKAPYLIAALDDPAAAPAIIAWLATVRPDVLHVAGPREGKNPGVYAS